VTIKRVGATKEYASNWALAFGKKESGRKKTAAKAGAKQPKTLKQKSSVTTKKTKKKASA
jgi:hypothetical protein